MKHLACKYWMVSLLMVGFLLFFPNREVQAQTYTDSIAFKIDSAKIVNSNLVYSIMFWRTNENWRGGAGMAQDTVLGNFDFYFWMKDVIFAKNQNPVILRKHRALGGVNDLLDIKAEYYAGRFRVQLLSKQILSSTMNVVGIPYNEPMELCKVQMALQYDDRNPEFVWDSTATGGQSYIGEPLIKDLRGDIYQNPDKSLVLEDYSGIERVCQGGVTKIWARGHSTGTKLNTSWLMSKKADLSESVALPSDLVGSFVGTGPIHYSNTVSTKWGDLFYMVSATNTVVGSRCDTLLIPNTPGWLDSMYFQCVLSDASLGVGSKKSTEGDTRIFLRDSIFGWFAASDPAKRADGAIGASDRTDTIFKCPSQGAYVSLYFFGPKCGEDMNTIGRSMTITYMGRDGAANPFQQPQSVKLTSWARESLLAPNGRCLYRGLVQLPDTLTDVDVWISSISTENGCDNGAAYVLYDTVHITDLAGNQQILIALTDTTLSSGETMALNTEHAYTNYYLKTPALGSLNLGTTPKTYKAPSSSCTNPNGCSDTIVYEYQKSTSIETSTRTCTMTAQQVVNLSDWFYVAPKLFLQGAYRAGTNKMTSFIMTNNLLPHASPYDNSVVASVFPAGKMIVDWIEISLREWSNIGTIVAKTSLFLLEDGTVIDTDGAPYARFKNLNPAKSYYVVIKHRNHLLVRSKCATVISQVGGSPTVVDFTLLSNVGGGMLAMLGTNLYGLFAGDMNSDNVVSGQDRNILLQASGQSGYLPCDINFDGVVSGTDRSVYLKNSGQGTGLFDAECP